MEKEFVTYELALRMKTLGFDEPCFGYYYRKEIDLFESCKIQERTNSSYVKEFMDKEDCVAPTWQSAFRWFREKYDLHILIDTGILGYYGHLKINPIGKLSSQIKQEWINTEEFPFKTYEEAEIACLEKLIEIVETKTE
jgi:hypothetical protein